MLKGLCKKIFSNKRYEDLSQIQSLINKSKENASKPDDKSFGYCMVAGMIGAGVFAYSYLDPSIGSELYYGNLILSTMAGAIPGAMMGLLMDEYSKNNFF